MPKKYPPLTPREVVQVLNELGFVLDRQKGAHAQYKHPVKKTLVTVDMGVSEFRDTLMKSMIDQSGFSREDFYRATKRTAKKI